MNTTPRKIAGKNNVRVIDALRHYADKNNYVDMTLEEIAQKLETVIGWAPNKATVRSRMNDLELKYKRQLGQGSSKGAVQKRLYELEERVAQLEEAMTR